MRQIDQQFQIQKYRISIVFFIPTKPKYIILFTIAEADSES